MQSKQIFRKKRNYLAPKHTTTEAKTETAVKEDVKKADTAAEKDASKVSKDAKKDVAKADKAVKADAKKVEKDVKGNKNTAVAQKTEPTRTVRPVRRSTLKALDQKQQAALEDKVFNELNKTYKTDSSTSHNTLPEPNTISFPKNFPVTKL